MHPFVRATLFPYHAHCQSSSQTPRGAIYPPFSISAFKMLTNASVLAVTAAPKGADADCFLVFFLFTYQMQSHLVNDDLEPWIIMDILKTIL